MSKKLTDGDTVDFHGMKIRVIRGEHHCEDPDCDKPVVTIRDPESGQPDEVHVEDLLCPPARCREGRRRQWLITRTRRDRGRSATVV